MKNTLFAAFMLLAYSSALWAQDTAPNIDWQISLGGTGHDNAQEMVVGSDGGYLFAGYTESTDFDASGNHGNGDGWIVKLDSAGSYQWHRCYGGTRHDRFNSITKMSSGNYLVCGQTSSPNGDVVGLHGESGISDTWVILINEAGDILWQRCLGGTKQDKGSFALETSDGAIAVLGITYSADGDVTLSQKGKGDIWLLKMDLAGNIIWQKSYGGSLTDFGYFMKETEDGGFIVISYTQSNDGDIVGFHGVGDGLVQKLDSEGNQQWQRCLGGSLDDYLHSVEELPNGEFVMVGRALSFDGDISGHHDNGRSKDYTLFKLDAGGNTVWQKCFGGTKDDCGYDVSLTSDGGFILIGHTYSGDGDVSGNHKVGDADYWAVKLDGNANIQWQKCMGGTGVFGDNPYIISQTEDGGYIMAGRSDSHNGDVTGNHGDEDLWVVKLEPTLVLSHSILAGTVTPLSYTAGDAIIIPFTSNGIFEEGNVYTAELSDDLGSFSNPQTIGSLTAGFASEISGIIPVSTKAGSNYRVRVVSSLPAVTGAANAHNITITINAAACTTADGLSATEISSTTALLQWNALPLAQSYKLRYKVTGTSGWTNVVPLTNSYLVTGLLANTGYSWQVRNVCQTVPTVINSSWTTSSTFSTTSLRRGENSEVLFDCFPNPVQDVLQIQWTIPQADHVKVELLDVANRQLAVFADGYYSEGFHQLNGQLTSYPAGMYLLRFRSGDAEWVKKLIRQ
jgi:hypothetical protein